MPVVVLLFSLFSSKGIAEPERESVELGCGSSGIVVVRLRLSNYIESSFQRRH